MKALLLVSFSFFSISIFSQEKQTAPLTDIIQMVSSSLQEVETHNKSGIELKSVVAEFTLSTTRSLGGEINIWILKLGRKVERTRLHTIKLSLEKEAGKMRETTKKKSSPELTKFLNSALADFIKLNDLGLLSELNKGTLTLTVGLNIKNDKSIGGEYSLGIFSIGADASKNKEQGHSLTIEFQRAK